MYIVGFTGPINHGKTSAARMLLAEEPRSKHIESWQIVAEVAQKLNHYFDPAMINTQDLTTINSWLYHLIEILPNCLAVRPTFDQIEIRDHELHAHESDFNKLFVYIDRLRDNPGLTHEEIEESNKEAHRPILQWLGGYLPKCIGETLWFDEIMKRVLKYKDRAELYTISGLRFPADAASVRRHGGKIIEIKRPDYSEIDVTDLTEAKRKLIEPDCYINNNGNLSDLEKVIKTLWIDLQQERLRIEYSAI